MINSKAAIERANATITKAKEMLNGREHGTNIIEIALISTIERTDNAITLLEWTIQEKLSEHDPITLMNRNALIRRTNDLCIILDEVETLEKPGQRTTPTIHHKALFALNISDQLVAFMKEQDYSLSRMAVLGAVNHARQTLQLQHYHYAHHKGTKHESEATKALQFALSDTLNYLGIAIKTYNLEDDLKISAMNVIIERATKLASANVSNDQKANETSVIAAMISVMNDLNLSYE